MGLFVHRVSHFHFAQKRMRKTFWGRYVRRASSSSVEPSPINKFMHLPRSMYDVSSRKEPQKRWCVPWGTEPLA